MPRAGRLTNAEHGMNETMIPNFDMQPRLVGISGPLLGQRLHLAAEEVSIGRESSNALWAHDHALSRRHCVIVREEDFFAIRDLQSHNGTLVNGERIETHQLRHRDQISVGDSVLVFLETEGGEHPANAPVELTDTGELERAAVRLSQEDAIYLQPERVLAELPQDDRRARDLNTLFTIAKGIGQIRDRDALEWQLLGMLFDVVPADRGAILHFAPEAENFDSAVAWDRTLGPGNKVQVSRTVIRHVLRDRTALLVDDINVNEDLRAVPTLAQLKVSSLICVPMIVNHVVQAVIYLDSRDTRKRFDAGHLQLITAVAGIASLALENVRLWESLREENRRLRSEIHLEHSMVGTSARMREILEMVQRVAPTSSTVLIEGESGTGKELVARALHRNSPRSDNTFVAINCAALTESLLESELFGHEKGAFTGAAGQKKGKIEVADQGTLFLDEISELALALQSKLLRVLQERELERVGGTKPLKVDIRLIAATNKSLIEEVREGRFRADLYYRLNVVTIKMPPLRERREDIPALALSFLEKFSKKGNTRRKELSPEALTALMQYDWPGNVRELENAIERAVVLGPEGIVLAEDLPETVLETSYPAGSSDAKYLGAVKENKKQLVLQAMDQAHGQYVEAAKILGIHPNSLLRLIRNMGLKAAVKGNRQSPPAGL
jgi:transcriptional regulator with GAF, ATPase, and Fis domain